MNPINTAGLVNIHGQKWTPGMCAKESIVAAPKTKAEPPPRHKGWRVIGIPPGELKAATESHARAIAKNAEAGGQPLKAFDPVAWAQSYRKVAVRTKAYEIPSAADECKALAERCGWTHVEVVAALQGAA